MNIFKKLFAKTVDEVLSIVIEAEEALRQVADTQTQQAEAISLKRQALEKEQDACIEESRRARAIATRLNMLLAS